MKGEMMNVKARPSKTAIAREVRRQILSINDGDMTAASEWLGTPIPALGNRRPRTLLRTLEGARQVQELVSRISHGIVSSSSNLTNV
jgi:putative toxin-antitoxin system antitoxin component (TIGR02293 family)